MVFRSHEEHSKTDAFKQLRITLSLKVALPLHPSHLLLFCFEISRYNKLNKLET